MLKLTYTETNCNLEYFSDSLEDWLSQRVVLALRTGKSISLEPSTASFTVSRDLPQLQAFSDLIDRQVQQVIQLTVAEVGFVEIGIAGSCLVEAESADAGIFVTSLGDRVEKSIFQLWAASAEELPSKARE